MCRIVISIFEQGPQRNNRNVFSCAFEYICYLAHKDAFNSLISDLKKKNPHWDRKSVDDQDLTARALFTEENTDGEI